MLGLYITVRIVHACHCKSGVFDDDKKRTGNCGGNGGGGDSARM